MKRWFVVQTHPKAENKALFNLKRQGYRAYLPTYLKKRSHARWVDWVARPLFPCYLFVEMEPGVTPWRAIRSTIGVSHFISAGDTPIATPEGVVEAIIAREDDKGHVALSNKDAFKKGQAVEIASGPMTEASAIFECIDDKDRVTVLMDLMGRQVRVRVLLEAVQATA